MAFSLPFEFNNSSISSWLSQLNSSEVTSVGHEICKVLKILKKEVDKVDHESLKLIVDRLTPVVIYTSGFLEKAFFDKSNNFNEQQRKLAQLNTLLLRHLAFLYVSLAEHGTDQENKNCHANYAVQLIGFALYSSALSYEKTPSSLWNMTEEVYKIALDDNFLDQAIKKPLAVFDKLPTINSVLKRNLLFSIGNYYNFSHQQIKCYFDFCSLHYERVELNRLSVKNSLGYCWEYASGQKPFPVTVSTDAQSVSKFEMAAAGKTIQPKLYFNIEPLLSAFRHSEIKVPVDKSVRLAEHLSNYQAIGESDLSLPRQYVFLFGFEQILEFLSRLDRKNSKYTFNPPTIEDLNFSSLDLTPANTVKKNKFQVESDEIWGMEENKIENIKLDYGAQKAFQTKLPDFLSVEWMKIEVTFGDMILMYGKNMDISIAIIRRVDKAVSNLNTQKGIVEIIKGGVSVVSLLKDVGKQQALLISKHDSFEMILSPGNYVLGVDLKIRQGKVVLDRLLECTSSFMRYEVRVELL